MYIKTKNLIIREFDLSDVNEILKIKQDEEVMKYCPDFIKRDATKDDIIDEINYYIDQRDTGNFERQICYAVCLQEEKQLIGAITVSVAGYLRETQIGWMFFSEVKGKGYASEAGTAVSDYILQTYGLEYMIVLMDDDNPASFRTAQKSGFRLFEKRVPYDYYYSTCNVENFNEVSDYFTHNQAQTGSCYYCFRKYNTNVKKSYQFYGDVVYTGRFS